MEGRSVRRGRWGPRETDVTCPACGSGRLAVRISCMHASVVCSACARTFTVAELSKTLGAEEFSAIAEAVGDRSSDRV